MTKNKKELMEVGRNKGGKTPGENCYLLATKKWTWVEGITKATQMPSLDPSRIRQHFPVPRVEMKKCPLLKFPSRKQLVAPGQQWLEPREKDASWRQQGKKRVLVTVPGAPFSSQKGPGDSASTRNTCLPGGAHAGRGLLPRCSVPGTDRDTSIF